MSSAVPDVIIYTTRSCGYCVRAKMLLRDRGIAYREVDVSGDAAARSALIAQTGRYTVPQIFIDGQPIGGYQELAAIDRHGGLRAAS